MERLEKLRSKLPFGIDAVLVMNELNVRYLGGVNYTDGFLLISREKAYLFADSRYIEVAKRDAAEGFDVRLLDKSIGACVNEFFGEFSVIGYEDKTMTCAQLEGLKSSLKKPELRPIGALIEEIRNEKDEYEKECIARAQRIAESAFEHILGYVCPDVTENDVALELEYYMRRHGADGIAFETIAASGNASSMPHAIPRNVKLQKGFLTMDFGAKYNGYCSDMTRTVCIGKPTEEMKTVYDTVLEAQSKALEFISAGVRCSDADKCARDVIAAAGYGKCFGHSLGHGVGLYIHEGISLSPRSEGVLKSGNVVTVEPGIYLEGRFGVRIEDMVYVTENGCENLTLTEKNLIVI